MATRFGVADGVYTQTHECYGLRQIVYLDKSITLRDGYTVSDWQTPDPVANRAMLDAEGQGRVTAITGSIAPTIEGFWLTGGDASGQGGASGIDARGGVYIHTANATIRNCPSRATSPADAARGLGVASICFAAQPLSITTSAATPPPSDGLRTPAPQPT